MDLQIVGAGLPRTGTASLKNALEQLLGGPCYHMREIPGHPFELGEVWNQALQGKMPDWEVLLSGYVAAVDWPAAMFWRELSEANPDAVVLLSLRDSPQVWWQSLDKTILPYARMSTLPDWRDGCGLTDLLERFTQSEHWDDPEVLMTAYERHNDQVRRSIPPGRLVEWYPGDGWEPVCAALGLPLPNIPFPWINRRAEWE